MNDSTIPVSPDEVGVWEDFVDIVHAPSAVFERRRSAGFWTPLVVIAVVMSVLSFSTFRILAPAVDADSHRQARAALQANPDMDVSGAQRMMDSAGTFFALAAGAFLAIGIFVKGFFVWVGGKVAGSTISGRSALMIATYAAIPTLIGGMVGILEGLVRGPANLDSLSRLSWSPARFMDPDANWRLVQFIATEIDVFTMWWAVLLAIGLSVIGKMPRARAAGVVAAIYVAMAIPGLIGLLAA